jgi:hypothetical protein
MPRFALGLVTLLVAAACATSTPGGPSPSSGPPKSLPELKLAVLDAVGGRLFYCDPDEYPLPRGDRIESARQRFPTIEADTSSFQAILQHEGLSAGQDFGDDQLITINEDYKQMQAIELQPEGSGYSFELLVPKAEEESGSESVAGTVSSSGTVAIRSRGPGHPINCPICLARGVRIATPLGGVSVEDIRLGMHVWTTDRQGRRIVGVVLEIGRMQAPLGHEVVRLALADGRTVTVSPGHPTADGRTVGDLRSGDPYDGSKVLSAVRIGYAGAFTFDLLPSGPTGTYFANGVLLGSTLWSDPAS